MENDDDIPGMLGIARGVANQTFPHTVDAQVWVKKWMKTIAEHPTIPQDEGTMLAWFANAIMAGYDTAQSRAAQQ